MRVLRGSGGVSAGLYMPPFADTVNKKTLLPRIVLCGEYFRCWALFWVSDYSTWPCLGQGVASPVA